MKLTTKLTVILVIVVAVLGVAVAYAYTDVDRQGPEIKYPVDDSFVYSAANGDEELYEGVIAEDRKDGDVTDTLTIEKKIVSSDEQYISVTYYAKDSSNNVTRSVRTVKYDASGEKEQEGDKKIDSSVIEGMNYIGSRANESNIAVLSLDAPRVRLSSYAVKIAVGSEFYPGTFVNNLSDDSATYDELAANLIIYSNVNTESAGYYRVTYQTYDSGNLYSNLAVLYVVVE